MAFIESPEKLGQDHSRSIALGRAKGTPMKRILGAMLALAGMFTAGHAAAQSTYPEKPIRIIVGFPPGSQADIVARLLGQKLAEALGKPIVVDNATGAAGNIAADHVAKAAPDGYTLGLLSNSQLVFSASLYKLAYDPVKDFAPVSQVTVSANMLVVHNAVQARSVKELVALAKAQPGTLTFASGGSGSAPHMAAALFNSVADVNIQHIPYKGVPPAIPDLLAGRVTMMFGPVSGVLPLVREGKLRALAVSTLKRSSSAPELPTIAESGYPGFEFALWIARASRDPGDHRPQAPSRNRQGAGAPRLARQIFRCRYRRSQHLAR
jgi:tripartite-type tricarboxylate transporter receptor subunit TctC